MAIFERDTNGIIHQVGNIYTNFGGGGNKEISSKYVRDINGAVREIYSSGPDRVDFVIGRITTSYCTLSNRNTYIQASDNVTNTLDIYPSLIPKHKCNHLYLSGWLHSRVLAGSRGNAKCKLILSTSQGDKTYDTRATTDDQFLSPVIDLSIALGENSWSKLHLEVYGAGAVSLGEMYVDTFYINKV